MRSNRNTYMTLAERKEIPVAPLVNPDSEISTKFRDIMLYTKAKGLSVEEYFRKFGCDKLAGQTCLAPGEFNEALVKL